MTSNDNVVEGLNELDGDSTENESNRETSDSWDSDDSILSVRAAV